MWVGAGLGFWGAVNGQMGGFNTSLAMRHSQYGEECLIWVGVHYEYRLCDRSVNRRKSGKKLRNLHQSH